jgi:metal-responsive CopG/Arc/MetJ family transcriptional regulator
MASTKEHLAISFQLPADLVAKIDELAHRELLSRSAWLRRETVLAVRASRVDEAAVA